MEAHSAEHPSDSLWPEGKGGLVELPERFVNNAGVIQNLFEGQSGSVAVIHTDACQVRSNHYHKQDAHYLYVLHGSFVYTEWDPQNRHDKIELNVKPGQMVYTPPMRAHLCTFIYNTTLISISKLTRTHDNHEADVVRL